MLQLTPDDKIDLIVKSLSDRFPSVDVEHIRTLAETHYDEFESRAEIDRFVPVFTARETKSVLREETGQGPGNGLL